MATVYSGYSGGWTPSGSSVSKKYRTRLDYSVSETDTTYTITARIYVNINSSVNADFYGYMNIAGTRKPSSGNLTCSTVYGSGNNTVACGGAYSQTINKTTESQTVTVYGYLRSNTTKGSWGTWQTASATITVPPIRYNITFNANGGANPPAEQKKVHGTALTLTTAIPTRDSFDFVSWNTAADGTGTSYASGDTLPATVNQATTLYAIWHRSYAPPTIANIRAYRVGASVTGVNPSVLSSGTRCYCDFTYTASVSPGTTLNSCTIKFGSASAISASTSSSKKYGYSGTNHLPTTSKEDVVITIKVTDYLGNAYTYTYTTYISIENYVFDAYKGTSGSTEYQAFAVGGIARDFSNSKRSAKGNFDIYMDMSIVLKDCTITDSGSALSVTAGATTDDGKLAQAVIDAFDYATAKDILEV